MLKHIFFVLCVIFGCGKLVDGSAFSSLYKLEKVYQNEGYLLSALQLYIKTEYSNVSRAQDETVLRFFQTTSDARSNIDDVTEWMGNPINAFHLIKRAAHDWRTVYKKIVCDGCIITKASEWFNATWTVITEKDVWAEDDDFINAAKGLTRIYDVYDVDLPSLIGGNIFDTYTDPLTSSDVLKIAIHQSKRGGMEQTWYEAYMKHWNITRPGMVKTPLESDIAFNLAMEYHMNGNHYKALDILKDLNTSKAIYDIVKKTAEEHDVKQHEETGTMAGPESHKEYKNKIYKKLCKGNIKTIKKSPSLRCYNTATRIPYYKGKEEVLSHFPRISAFHDCIHDTEIAQIKEFSKDLLNTSMTQGLGASSKVSYNTRVSQTCWLNSTNLGSLSTKLERRISLLTGLNVLNNKRFNSEQLQVVNYGVAGHFSLHSDILSSQTPTVPTSGNRIATWMFYLNTVKEGGATVFPVAGIRVPAIKGMSVFWYNLLPSGATDARTEHAGCPVLLGAKWITTKWIREFGQGDVKSCTLDRLGEYF